MSTEFKNKPVKYTSKEFDSIKQDLINYAKAYYPDTYRDFNDASFGALMLDMVAYVGDILSFYVDYQANETYLDTAIEKKNLLKLAKQVGFKMPMSYTATGKCAFYIQVPANSDGSQNADLVPILKEGTVLSSQGGNTFVLANAVDFTHPDVEVAAGKIENEVVQTWAYKAYGDVISGRLETEIKQVTQYEKFLKIDLNGENISEIISVFDSEGNEYFEVQYLSQNIVLQAIRNPTGAGENVPYILKEKLTPRRFITEVSENGFVSLQFGYGSEDSLKNNQFPDPSSVVLNRYARNYYNDDSFDPSILLKTGKFGVVPPVGNLAITYRRNDSPSVNAAVATVDSVTSPILFFKTDERPTGIQLSDMVSSIETDNEEPIIGQITELTPEEIRTRALDVYAAQNRAVTKQDYLSLVYQMPSKFGAIKRANIVQDKKSLKRNLNLYVISEDADQKLVDSSSTLKTNLKTWLLQHKMINDTVDIIDGRIVNFGIEFKVLGVLDKTQQEVLEACLSKLKQEYTNQLYFGRPFYISDIYKLLNDLDEVIDTQDVVIKQKFGTNYSTYDFDVEGAITDDGRFIVVPDNVVLELKYPDTDIIGVVL